jgi:hypothetical protein
MTLNKNNYQIDISDGIVLIKNQNTTIAYCRFLDSGINKEIKDITRKNKAK